MNVSPAINQHLGDGELALAASQHQCCEPGLDGKMETQRNQKETKVQM
jgi:hypothetical protein